MLERYANQLVIFLLLYIPFILSSLWNAGRGKKFLAGLLLLMMCLDTLHTGAGNKAFIRDATAWVAQNTPADSTLMSNEKYIAYYSGREFDWQGALRQNFQTPQILATPALWQNADYLVLYVRRRQLESFSLFLQENALREMKVFDGGSYGRVSIVQIRAAQSQP